MEYTTKCNGCGEEFYESELKNKLCEDCQYLNEKAKEKRRKNMKVNFNQPLMKLGAVDPLLKPNSTETFCLKDAAIEALLGPEENQSGEEKAKRYLMATRIYANAEGPDFTIEEVATIKRLIGKGYGSLIVGQAWEMLEGKE